MFEGKKVRLVPYSKKHFEDTLKWVNDAYIAVRVNRVLPVTASEHLDWYEHIVKDKSQIIFAIELKADGTYAGNCGLKNIDNRSHKAELWIYLGNEFANQGLGKDATKLLLDYGFDFLNLNRIYLYIVENNKIAEKLYESCGFKKEGLCREDVFMEGNYYDTVWMGLLKEEYKK